MFVNSERRLEDLRLLGGGEKLVGRLHVLENVLDHEAAVEVEAGGGGGGRLFARTQRVAA